MATGVVLSSLLAVIPAGSGLGAVAPEITGIASGDQDIDPGETRAYNVLVTGYEDGGSWQFSGTGLTATVSRTRTGGARLTVVATTTAEAGARSLTVVNPDGLSDTFSNAITVTGSNPPPTSGDVSGHVFDDEDGDGVRDDGEPGLAGVDVSVTDASGGESAASTDGAGDFVLTGLAVGDANLVYATPSGRALTTGNASQAVTVVDGETSTADDVGYEAIPTGSVVGHVFVDSDGNGVEDGTDSGLAGVTVSVVDAVGVVNTLTTDALGDFEVSGLAIGEAQVDFTAAASYTLTTGNNAQTVSITAGGSAQTDAVGYLLPADNRPNFVVIVTDDQRWDTIGRCTPVFDGTDLAAGSESCMPSVQSLLVANGTTFLKGEVTQSLCCPSRASILTGQYSTTHGVTNNDGSDLDDSSTVATWLDDEGYRTGLFGKYLNGYGSGTLANYVPPGWDSFHAFHGFSNRDNPYTDYPWINWDSGGSIEVTRYNDADSASEAACADGNLYSTDLICAQASDFLEGDAATPFLLYLAPAAPHNPNTPADRHIGAFNTVVPAQYPDYDAVPSPNPPAYLPTQSLGSNFFNRVTNALRAALRTNLAVDDMVTALVDQLAADGRLGNTVWVFISDNGYAAGEHRLTNKQCEYLICHRVPFVVVCPPAVCAAATPGVTDPDHYALNIDIAPTIADLAGVAPTLAVDGMSLLPIIEDRSAQWRTEWFLHESNPLVDGIVAVAGDGVTYKYVELGTGELELYDLEADPFELVNLAGNSSYGVVEAELAAKLAAFLAP